MSENPFTPDVIAAVARHMNGDHSGDSLLIVQTLGGAPDAVEATVSHLDGDGVDFEVITTAGDQAIRIPWSRPLRERPEIREEFVRMAHDAARRQGDNP